MPELGTSVFLIPGELVKNREDRLIVLNRIAKSVVDSVRGQHSTHVFSYRSRPVVRINNSAWKRARRSLDLPIRVHDLKHTWGRRLRAAGVPLETRKILLGHRNGDITSHYSAPELEELIEAANSVCEGKSGKTPALVVLQQRQLQQSAANCFELKGLNGGPCAIRTHDQLVKSQMLTQITVEIARRYWVRCRISCDNRYRQNLAHALNTRRLFSRQLKHVPQKRGRKSVTILG